MKKVLMVIVFFIMVATVGKSDTLSRYKFPKPKFDNIVNHVGFDKVEHFSAGYLLQDLSYKFLFRKTVQYTINGKVVEVKEGRKYGKTSSVVLNVLFWVAKVKYVDTTADWKDAGASSLGIGTWLIRKQF